MKDQITRCALYTRVSTRQQLENDYNSLDAQKDRLLAYVDNREKFVTYKIYEDRGFSAKDFDRPALQEMLRDIRESKIDSRAFI